MADWAELLTDLLELIRGRLIHLPDQYRFGGVCKSWRTVVLNYRQRDFPHHIPGLMIPGINCNMSCKTRRFLASPIGKIAEKEQQLPVLSVPHESLCRGSYEGWLVMVDTNMTVYLYNPFSESRIDLPPVTALPKPRLEDTLMSKWYVKKAILSTSPSTPDCIVVVIYGRGELAFCKVGDKTWSLIDCIEPWGYVDALFYKGQFHVVTSLGIIYTSDLNIPQPKLTDPDLPQGMLPYVKKWYLVEAGGELLRILRRVTINSACDGNDGDDGEDEAEEYDSACDGNDGDDGEDEAEEYDSACDGNDGEDEDENEAEEYDDEYDNFDYDNYYSDNEVSKYVSKTTGFEVCRLDSSSGAKPEWIEVNKLDGEEALFLGLNQSFSLSNPLRFGYKENRIYFTDDNIGSHKLCKCSGNDMGVFNIEDSKFEQLYVTNSESTRPPAIWVTPTPW